MEDKTTYGKAKQYTKRMVLLKYRSENNLFEP